VKRLDLRQTRPSAAAISAIALVAGLIVGAATGAVDTSGLLHLAPALVLAVALLVRRYPGERLIVRLTGSARRPRRCGRALALKPQVHVAVLVPRGGLLLGRSLAVRPPPGPALLAS
jgi:hypothetical protein